MIWYKLATVITISAIFLAGRILLRKRISEALGAFKSRSIAYLDIGMILLYIRRVYHILFVSEADGLSFPWWVYTNIVTPISCMILFSWFLYKALDDVFTIRQKMTLYKPVNSNLSVDDCTEETKSYIEQIDTAIRKIKNGR